MSEEVALIRAILNAPEIDAPRLVYADWLEERGQVAQAEFIRVSWALGNFRLNDTDQAALECPQPLHGGRVLPGPAAPRRGVGPASRRSDSGSALVS